MTKQIRYACFSDAIREGAKLRPQTCEGSFFVYFEFGNRRGSCAMGAGYEAATGEYGADSYTVIEMLREMFPYFVKSSDSVCPICPMKLAPDGLYGQVMHLNDYHHWTRERIADWLDAEEEKLGFITITEEAEAFNPTMISEYETVKATA